MSPLYTYNGKLLIKDGALATSQSCCCGGQCPPSSFYDSLCVSIDVQSYGASLQASGQLFNNSTWSDYTQPSPPGLGANLTISCANGIVTLYTTLLNNSLFFMGLTCNGVPIFPYGATASITFPFSSLIGTHTINYYYENTTECILGTMTVTFSNPPC
jgi:hypothetical protein